MITLAAGVHAAVVAHAQQSPSIEVCGLLIGTRGPDGVTITDVHPTANVAAEGCEDRFTVDPRVLLRLEEELEPSGTELVGVYHSHPRTPPDPSLLDRRNAALWPSFVHAIAGRDNGDPIAPTGAAALRCRPLVVRWYWSDSGGVLSSAPPCTPACSSLSKASKAAGSPPS
ncbi:MAG: M67 family metallopeptidase [Proteobacteria bacterium]|nr:M67 family metallopeptidase [Pseudomonadota bacterium]